MAAGWADIHGPVSVRQTARLGAVRLPNCYKILSTTLTAPPQKALRGRFVLHASSLSMIAYLGRYYTNQKRDEEASHPALIHRVKLSTVYTFEI